MIRIKQGLIVLIVLITTNAVAQIPNSISKTEKIYGLSKFWSEVNYNFVYLNKINREEWNKNYRKLLSDVQSTKNDYEYYKLLQKFCASLNDGHTNIFFPDTIQNIIYNTYFGEYRFFLSNFENRAIITRVNLSKKDEIPIGTEIIKVNGIETSKYIEQEVIPYISSSTEYIRRDRGISRMLMSPVGTSYELTLKLPNDEIRNISVTHSKTLEKEVYPAFDDWKLLKFKWIGKDIAYVALNSFNDPKIDSLFIDRLPELYKAKKIIIDLRKNGGGNTLIGRNIFQYLTKDTLLYGSKSQSRLHIPAYKAWGKWETISDTINNAWAKQAYLSYNDNYYYNFSYEPYKVQIDKKRINVPTVLLIGHNTASAAEDFLIYADNQEQMTTIGEPTFGSTGQPMFIELPGGGSARICTKKDVYPDGREFVGYGVIPDIEVKQSIDDLLENRDVVLQKAIEFLNKK